MFKRRVSKYRHLYGSPSKKDEWYEGIRATTNAHDTNFCEVNPKFFAVVTESTGGGVFLVLPLSQAGRLSHSSLAGRVVGHRGAVTDIKWSPFDDNLIASCSDDATVKVWTIPDEGVLQPLEEPTYDLQGHHKRVSRVEWHPLVHGVLLSAALDYRCIVWNVFREEVVYNIVVHNDVIFSIHWSPCGRYFSTTCKDKTIRVIDPRKGTVVTQGEGHQGTKSSKVVFVDTQHLFTTGFSRMSERQYALWDISDLSKPLKSENIDHSSGVLMPYYDKDTRVMFLAGKGDGNIRFYEVSTNPPYIQFLNQYQSNMPQRGLGQMCKRGVDVRRCEIVRFYKLHTNKDLCEPISMIVPRKSELFQEDLFPPTNSYYSNISPAEWFNGFDREPDKIDLAFQPPVPKSHNNDDRALMSRLNKTQQLDERLGVVWGSGGGGCGGDGGVVVGGGRTVFNGDGADATSDVGGKQAIVTKEQGIIRRDGEIVSGDDFSDVIVRLRGNTSAAPTPKVPASLRNIHRLSTTDCVAPASNDFSSSHRTTATSFKSGFYNIGSHYQSRVEEQKNESKQSFVEQALEIERLRGELERREEEIRRLQEETKRLKHSLKTQKMVEGGLRGVKA